MKTRIVLTFNQAPELGDTLSILINDGVSNNNFPMTFVNLRQSTGQTTIGADENDTSLNYMGAWNVDYKNYGGVDNLKASSTGINEVTIEVDNGAWQVQSVSGDVILNGYVDYEIINESQSDPYSVATSFHKNIANPCSSIDVQFDITGGLAPYTLSANGGLEYVNVNDGDRITFVRQQIFRQYEVRDDNNDLIGVVEFWPPRSINDNDIQISVTYDSSQAGTIIINHTLFNQVVEPFTYSIDDVTYKSQNSFSNLAPGNYTVYIKDAFDCIFQKNIVIDGISETLEIVCEISDVNPIHYAVVENGKRNYKNSISCKENREIANTFTHKFLATHTPKTQIKTNAPYIRAYTIDENQNESNLSVLKAVENLGQIGYTEATLYSKNGKAHLYYGVVNTLNLNDDSITGAYDYGIFVPAWIEEDKFITVEGIGTIAVERVVYDEGKRTYVAQLPINYNGNEDIRNVRGDYNHQLYDVYEFETIMQVEPDSFHIGIDVGTDANNLTHQYLSEKIIKVEDSDNLLEIKYKSLENRGKMVYQTGIEHTILIEGYLNYVGEQETEGYNGDKEYYKVDDEVYYTEELYIPNITTNIAHKLRLILAHDILEINGIPYKLADPAEVDGPLTSNEKYIKATLKATGNQFLPDGLENYLGDDIGITGGLEAIEGKALILHTKING